MTDTLVKTQDEVFAWLAQALRSCGQRSCEVVAWGCSDH